LYVKIPNHLLIVGYKECKRAKVVPYSINKCWSQSWSQCLGSQPTAEPVINLVVVYHYFPSGLQLLSQPKNITVPWPVLNYFAWWQRHTGMSSLPKAIMQWCLAMTRTCSLWIASQMPYQ